MQKLEDICIAKKRIDLLEYSVTLARSSVCGVGDDAMGDRFTGLFAWLLSGVLRHHRHGPFPFAHDPIAGVHFCGQPSIFTAARNGRIASP